MFGGYEAPHRLQMRSACVGTEVRNPLWGVEMVGIETFMFIPQRPQKREPAASTFEHRGHGNEPGGPPALIITNERLPQRPQNFTPSAKREPHREQATIPGMRLEVAPPLLLPCEGEGWLDPPWADRSCA